MMVKLNINEFDSEINITMFDGLTTLCLDGFAIYNRVECNWKDTEISNHSIMLNPCMDI